MEPTGGTGSDRRNTIEQSASTAMIDGGERPTNDDAIMGGVPVEERTGARRARNDAGTEMGGGRGAPSTPSGRSPDPKRLDGKDTPRTPRGLDEIAAEFFARADMTGSELNAGNDAERRPSNRADDTRSVGTASSITGQMQVCATALPRSCTRARRRARAPQGRLHVRTTQTHVACACKGRARMPPWGPTKSKRQSHVEGCH